jgi:alginate O-acetyltransferase complex protein AlgJ
MSAEVHVGLEEWLFLAGGTNEVLRFYDEADFFEEAGRGWVEQLRIREAMARERGLLYRHLIVPDKLTIYPEFYRDTLANPQNAPSLKLPQLLAEQADAARLGPVLVDVRDAMNAAKSSSPKLYWKTDAHWTFEGCWVAFLALCENLRASVDHTILDSPEIAGDHFLDLGSKLDPPVAETLVTKLFNKGAERAYTNPLVEYKERENAHDVPGLHVGSHIVLRNTTTATDPRTIILFGDSYSEYRMHELTGLLGETFASTHFIWNSSVDWDYVDEVQPNIIVTELAERFHTLVPTDELRIGQFSRDRLNEYLSSLERPAATQSAGG